MAENYAEDEFDRLAEGREAIGAHRRQPRVSAWMLWLIAILIISPIVGIVGGQILSNDSDVTRNLSSSHSSAQSKQAEADKKAAAEKAEVEKKAAAEKAEAEKKAAEEKAEAERKAAQIQHDTLVRVLNGRGVQGLAAEQADILRTAGYTTVQADNYRSSVPADSTVYYGTEDMKATAEDVAKQLKITQVQMDPDAVGGAGGVAVVIR